MTAFHLIGLIVGAGVGVVAMLLHSDPGIGLAGAIVSGILGHAQGSRSSQKRATDSVRGTDIKITEKETPK